MTDAAPSDKVSKMRKIPSSACCSKRDVYVTLEGRVLRRSDGSIVQVTSRTRGGGKKKGPRKTNQTEQSSTNKSSPEADMAFELVTGGLNDNLIKKMMDINDEATEHMTRTIQDSIRF